MLMFPKFATKMSKRLWHVRCDETFWVMQNATPFKNLPLILLDVTAGFAGLQDKANFL